MKYLYTILASAVVSISTTSYAVDKSAEVESNFDYKDDGGYEAKATAKTKSLDGTVKTSETIEEMDVDSEGKIEKTIEKTSTTDPKGLFNKEKNTAELEISDTENGGYTKTLTKEYVDRDGTDVTIETVTEVDVDDEGNVLTTVTEEKTVDPKGLFNKTSSAKKTKAINGVLQ